MADLGRDDGANSHSADNNVECGVEASQIVRIGTHDLLARSASADHHVCVDNVGRTARREKSTDTGGVDSV